MSIAYTPWLLLCGLILISLCSNENSQSLKWSTNKNQEPKKMYQMKKIIQFQTISRNLRQYRTELDASQRDGRLWTRLVWRVTEWISMLRYAIEFDVKWCIRLVWKGIELDHKMTVSYGIRQKATNMVSMEKHGIDCNVMVRYGSVRNRSEWNGT